MKTDVRRSLELRRRELIALVQRMQRSGPWSTTFELAATLRDAAGAPLDPWALAGFSEPVELEEPLPGVTGCDVYYRVDGSQLFARVVFRSQHELAPGEITTLTEIVRALPGPRRLPRVIHDASLRFSTEISVLTERLTPDEHAAERERSKAHFSKIDAEIDAQLSALPNDTVQEERDRKFLTNARGLMREVAARAKVTLDGSLESLDTVTHIVGGLALLDKEQQYLGLPAERYRQLVLVACAVYVGEVALQHGHVMRLHCQFNEAGSLREVELIDAAAEDDLRILRLLTLCMKCAESFAEYDLRRAVTAWLNRPEQTN